MAKFFEQVKNLMGDVELLLGQVKDSKLSGSAKTLKTSVLQQIRDIREERPQLAPNVSTEPACRASVNPALTDDDLYEDPNADTFQHSIQLSDEELLKKDVPASDRTDIFHEGVLKYRKEKKSGIFGKSKSKLWCVIRGKIFYIYDKKISKKQNECFIIVGYQATPMDKEGTKKDITFPFEMACDNKKTFVFDALTVEDQSTWLKNIQQVAGVGPRKRPLTVGESSEADAIDEDLYEEADNYLATNNIEPSESSLHSNQSVRKERPPPAADAESGQSSTSPSGESISNYPGELYDATAQMEDDPNDLYDSTDVTEDMPLSNSPDNQPERSRMSTPPPPDIALPPIPATPPRTVPNVPTVSPPTPPRTQPPVAPAIRAPLTCSDMYYGVWDCSADNDKELTFSRGDVIAILSKEYEDRGWWVGKLREQIGLVPKDYMTEAYERA